MQCLRNTMPSRSTDITTAEHPPPADEHAIARLLDTVRCPFGPRFFLERLAGFVRDRCPDASERMPRLELWIAGSEPIRICHVIALAPQWVAVAAAGRDGEMRTEIVPYELITRVTIAAAPRERGIGFDQARRPLVLVDGALSPEEALALAAGPPAAS